MRRSRLLPAPLVVILAVVALVVIVGLIGRADSSRREQLRISTSTLALADLQSAPFNADAAAGGRAAAIDRRIATDEDTIAHALTTASQPGASATLLRTGQLRLGEVEPIVSSIYRLAIGVGGLEGSRGNQVPDSQKLLVVRSGQLSDLLDSISRTDALRASREKREAEAGATVALVLLLAVFLLFYRRSLSLVRQNALLLEESRGEATTDALTGLGNRRALETDLALHLKEPAHRVELLLAMFDLDGFKQYNDSYGHPAGDALLQRLGVRLAAVASPLASAYRMGGDEFCLLSRCSSSDAARLLASAAAALTDKGAGWQIGCSYGAGWIPSEAATGTDALRLADQRMYANKRSRASASRQLTDVLLQVITEQGVQLDEHVERVARMSADVAEGLGQPEHEVQLIHLAAILHDVGKTAIPTEILHKPGPLNAAEWEFVRRHTLIGERIVLAAPALAAVAPLVRSSHEWTNGQGYPDGLSGEHIPIGSRIIAVCDAFDAMTSDRPYREMLTADAALKELRRCQGTQFDTGVVDAFHSYLSAGESAPGEARAAERASGSA